MALLKISFVLLFLVVFGLSSVETGAVASVWLPREGSYDAEDPLQERFESLDWPWRRRILGLSQAKGSTADVQQKLSALNAATNSLILDAYENGSLPLGTVQNFTSVVGVGGLETLAAVVPTSQLLASGFVMGAFSLPAGITLSAEEPPGLLLLVSKSFTSGTTGSWPGSFPNFQPESPVSDLQVYPADNSSVMDPSSFELSSALNLPEGQKFNVTLPVSGGSSNVSCTRFDLVTGSLDNTSITTLQPTSSEVICRSPELGIFLIVSPLSPLAASPSPSPSQSPSPSVSPTETSAPSQDRGVSSTTISGGAVAGIVVGSLAGFGLIALLLVFVVKKEKRNKISRYEQNAAKAEALSTHLIDGGARRAPAAMSTRTRARLEDEQA